MLAMNIASVVAQLKLERDRLDKAIATLTGLNGTGRNSTGKRKRSAAVRKPTKRTNASSDVSRLAQNLRWARQLKKGPQAIRAADKALKAAQARLAKRK